MNLVNSKIQNPITTNQPNRSFDLSPLLSLSRPCRLLLSNAQPSAGSLPLRRISPARATLCRLPLSQRERLSLAKVLPHDLKIDMFPMLIYVFSLRCQLISCTGILVPGTWTPNRYDQFRILGGGLFVEIGNNWLDTSHLVRCLLRITIYFMLIEI